MKLKGERLGADAQASKVEFDKLIVYIDSLIVPVTAFSS